MYAVLSNRQNMDGEEGKSKDENRTSGWTSQVNTMYKAQTRGALDKEQAL